MIDYIDTSFQKYFISEVTDAYYNNYGRMQKKVPSQLVYVAPMAHA